MIEQEKRYSELWSLKHKMAKGNGCPDCGEEYKKEPDMRPCSCSPLWIVIPAGEHIHIDCPRHGKVRINGPSRNWG